MRTMVNHVMNKRIEQEFEMLLRITKKPRLCYYILRNLKTENFTVIEILLTI